MSGLSFADIYREAGFTPSPEIIRLRQAAVERIRKSLEPAQVVDAARLFFGLPLPDGGSWFKDAFVDADPSFSMVDNQREAAVLAACLLAAEIQEDNVAAGFATLTTALIGARTPIVQPQVVEQARQQLHKMAVSSPSRNRRMPMRDAANVASNADALAETGDWPKAAAFLKQMVTEEISNSNRLGEQIGNLREEVEILWWYVGGWSRTLDQPFTELSPGAAALIAGLELAELTDDEVGPAAAPALLLRIISAERDPEITAVTIADCIDGLVASDRARLSLPTVLTQVCDVCPVLGGLSRAIAMNPSTDWHEGFKQATKVDASSSFAPSDLALQVFRERQLLTQLE